MTYPAPENQTVLVTGAEGALGSVVADRFHTAGCKVLAGYLHEKAPQWKSSERFIPTQLDVTDPGSLKKTLGSQRIDIAIHCAGGFRFATVDEFKDADLDFLLNLNLRSSFLLARELVPGMKARGFGRLVFVSSRATLAPGAGMGLYAASKAGINALVQSLAEEVKRSDITVNAVLPSIIDTPANRREMPNADFSSWVGREALADIIYLMTREQGSAVQGALIPVAGRV